MSKNVAVFVDVANIFYAAKAAGVDIDYVTLLKSATSGRDFVRAYAYTGLDPENENQRQFHSFLSRSGYKVISKDIRKYGDGRIKANLDIELVVDMMRMAEHLDICVVVSGDGDFAPAIRAVQQMGVRVEVISFRGNTSSDLIEVADVFTDITQVARVEKGVRSGRRVAAEGDLSMTEVPEKETEGPVRRRRGMGRRTPERETGPAIAVTAADGLPGNVIVLPGERLSRAPAGDDESAEDEMAEGVSIDGGESEDSEARRRRRRRGGRGRGRSRRPETDLVPATEVSAVSEEDDEGEGYEDESPVALPQHSTFGSVWDSQLGVSPATRAAAVTSATPSLEDDEYDDEDEPEIPEYLLAERRQQQSRQRGRGGHGASGSYRTALDRERYGRGGAPSHGGGAGMRAPDRGRTGRGGSGERPAQQRQPRPDQGRSRPPYREQPVRQAPPAPLPSAPSAHGGTEPWSEVPLEVQELLRAELARRSDGRPTREAPRDRGAAPAEPTRARSPRSRTSDPRTSSRSTATTGDTPATADAVTEAAVSEATPTRATRTRRATTPTAAATPDAAESAATEPKPKRPTTRKTSTSRSTAARASAEGASAAPKPRRRTSAAAPTSDEATSGSGDPGSGDV